jgi:hypothetical protein
MMAIQFLNIKHRNTAHGHVLSVVTHHSWPWGFLRDNQLRYNKLQIGQQKIKNRREKFRHRFFILKMLGFANSAPTYNSPTYRV